MGWLGGAKNYYPARKNSTALKSFFLYWNTIRFLKPIQVFGRIWFALSKPNNIDREYIKPDHPKGRWYPTPQKKKIMSGSETFNFLNIKRNLKDITWQATEMSKLWRYNLHYFDFLNSDPQNHDNQKFHFLVSDWIAKNKPFCGDAWDPYPTSLRIVNWIKWTIQGNELNLDCQESLAIQANWLSKRLERHMKGNHLLANAKALIFAGLYFEGNTAKKWLHTGIEIIEEELHEQILEDGGHFERSTMYHAIVLEDILDLLNIFRLYQPSIPITDSLPTLLSAKAKIMIQWLGLMTHPDGGISYFNDAALGSCLNFNALYKYAEGVGVDASAGDERSCMELKDSGFCRIANKKFTAVLDVGPIGASYIPGHAHADTLSFEMSLLDQRIIVNGGTSTYQDDQQRHYERGTTSHSTVTLESMDSSEVWSAFRVARRAEIIEKKCDLQSMQKIVICSHDGYVSRLPGNPLHQRTWKFDENEFLVSDEIQSSKSTQGVARFIMHPDIEVNVLRNGNSWSLNKGSKCLLNVEVLVGSGKKGSATFAKAFGQVVPTTSIDVFLQEGRASTRFSFKD